MKLSGAGLVSAAESAMKASGLAHVLRSNCSGQLTSKKQGVVCNLVAPLPQSSDF